jgi:hypothetical protein
MYSVDKGVPLNSRRRSKHEMPYAAMQVGESFLVPAGAMSMTYICKLNKLASVDNKKFVSRKTEGGVRVWRVA